MERHKTVDAFIAASKQWQPELVRLRSILLSTKLEETVKWGGPCYTHQGKNVVGIGRFKSYFGVWFYQGALLQDTHNVLINAQEGKTKALRQWRMQSAKDIKPRILKAYVREAVELQARGLSIKAERNQPLSLPHELTQALGKNQSARKAFAALTKGRQREYADYVASAKRDETKQKRLAKILPLIIQGIGLNDRYRSPKG